MFLADCHCHTQVSIDSETPLNAMLRAAKEAGLTQLCVTDHCDLLSLEGVRQLEYDWGPALAQLRAAQIPSGLTLRLGIELGCGFISPAHAGQILSRPELDFVIGSLHNRPEASGGTDYYYVKYDSPETCRTILDDYFTCMESLVACPACYDVLGHIIYPLRYMVRDGQQISLVPWYDRLRAILRTAVQTGRGIEVNTWCGRTVEQWRDVLALYRAVGGEIVTVGSDAHVPENVGRGIREAYALLREMGFSYVASYEKRTPHFEKLPL